MVLPNFCFLLKLLEFPQVHASNLEFHWIKILSMVHLVYSRMESLVFFQTFKPIDDICVVCPTTIVTPTSLCMHSQKLSTNIFHYVIIKKYIFKIILFDYKLNNILNKQSLLFQTLSSNGYLNNFLIPKFLS